MVETPHLNSPPPIQSDEFLPPISRWTTLGRLLITGSVGVAIVLAFVTPYNVTVRAQANVRPAGENRIIQSAGAGKVVNISVEENQPVKAGDVIATIDNSDLQIKKRQQESNLQQMQQQIVEIDGQINALDNQIVAETERRNRAIVSAEADLRLKQRTFQNLQVTTQAEVREAQAALELARDKVFRYRILVQQGVISQVQLKEQESALKTATAKWEAAKAPLNPINAEVEIASEHIAQEKAIGEATLAKLNGERKALKQHRHEISKQQSSTRLDLEEVERNLSQTAITAPSNGIISTLNLRNPGQIVRQGDEIAQIVPSDVPWVIKAAVAPQERNKLKQGQNVHMRVSACPYPDHGTLKGKVSKISEDTIKPQSNGATAIASITASDQKGGTVSDFYEVTIEPESRSFGKGASQCTLKLGYEGRVDIISQEETVLKFLLRKARLITDL